MGSDKDPKSLQGILDSQVYSIMLRAQCSSQNPEGMERFLVQKKMHSLEKISHQITICKFVASKNGTRKNKNILAGRLFN